jgi:hypothetical protein
MLSTEKIKGLIGDKKLADDEIERIRAACYELAEIVFMEWQRGTNKGRAEDITNGNESL